MLGEYIDSERAAQLSQRDVRDPNPWLGLGAEGFTAQYNRQPFLIWHRLHEYPLLQRDAVFELCRRHPRSSVMLRAGKYPSLKILRDRSITLAKAWTSKTPCSISSYGRILACTTPLLHRISSAPNQTFQFRWH